MPTGHDARPTIVLDTSAYAWLRTGHADVLRMVADADIVWIPVVVLGELEAGFELGSRPRENRVLLEEFLGEPFVAVRLIDRAVALRYGRVFAQLRRSATPIPVNDVWIAATALESAATVVTFDRHYEMVAGLDTRLLAPTRADPPRRAP